MSEGRPAVTKEVSDTVANRISERLGNPFLFAFVVTSFLEGWRFVYALVGGRYPKDWIVNDVIRNAETYLSWKAFCWNVGIAVLFTVGWPFLKWINAEYQVVIDLWSEKRIDRRRLGKAIPLKALKDHEHYKWLRNERILMTLALRWFAGRVYSNSKGADYVIARLSGQIITPCFLGVFPVDDVVRRAEPLEVHNLEHYEAIIYAVDAFQHKGEVIAFGASENVLVPWPQGKEFADAVMIFATDQGGLVGLTLAQNASHHHDCVHLERETRDGKAVDKAFVRCPKPTKVYSGVALVHPDPSEPSPSEPRP